jgi:hypothetical protein
MRKEYLTYSVVNTETNKKIRDEINEIARLNNTKSHKVVSSIIKLGMLELKKQHLAELKKIALAEMEAEND